jgi:hypothetical protein
MSAAEQEKMYERVKLNGISMRAALVAACAVDAEGKALFAPDDLVALGNKSAAAFEKLFNCCLVLNGMTEAAREEKKTD